MNSSKKKTGQTAAAKYRELTKKQTAEIVEVTAPSGFVFKFQKLNPIASLFSGELEKIGEMEKEGDDDDKTKQMLYFRDKTLQLSASPKIVIGKADANNDELSTDDISDEDLMHLLAWVMSGSTFATVK